MKINNAELKNFRNHGNTFMEFEKLNFVFGKNNVGKSTIKGGLQLALTGENEWAKAGKNQELIKYGETEASLEIEIDNVGIIRRTINKKGNVVELNDGKLPDKEVEKELENSFGVSYEPLSCAMDSAKFFSMNANQQKDFLFRLSTANNSITSKTIVDFMDNPSKDAENIVLSRLPGNITTDILDVLYSEFVAERKVAKKELASSKSELDSLGTVPDNSGVDIAMIKGEKDKLVVKRENVIKAIATIDGNKKQKDRLEGYIQDKTQKLTILQKELDSNIDLKNADKDIAAAKDTESKFKQELASQKTLRDVTDSQNQRLKTMYTKLDSNTCPLSDKLTCKTDKSSLKGDLSKQISDNDSTVAKAADMIKSIEKDIEGITTKREKIEKQVRIKADLKALEAEIDALKKDSQAITVGNKTSLEAELNNYDLDKKVYDGLEKTHSEWEQKFKKFNELKDRIENKTKEVNLLEYLVKEFSPKGVKTRLLEKIISSLETHCNKTTGILTGGAYSLKFDLSNGFEIMVTNAFGVNKLSSMSASEKWRLGIIFQDAVSSLTNAKVICIDDAEILDSSNMKLFLELLAQIKDNYDSIFVFGTIEDPSLVKQLKSVPESKTFIVDGGTVKTI